MSGGRFSVLVRFDLDSGIRVSVGGEVPHGGIEELCEVVERSVQMTGRRVLLDLESAHVADEVLAILTLRCSDIATVVPPLGARERSLGDAVPDAGSRLSSAGA
jgi:hypothetical protein